MPVFPPPPAAVYLSDGRAAQVREITPSDRAEVDALHANVGRDSVRLRFFSVGQAAGQRYVDHLFDQSGDTVLALVVTVHDHVVGVAAAERLTAQSAEIAFLVADDERGHGVGTLLLEHLASSCHDQGILQFVADVLPENHRMVQVFTDAGYAIVRAREPGLLVFELSTHVGEQARRASRARMSIAATAAARIARGVSSRTTMTPSEPAAPSAAPRPEGNDTDDAYVQDAVAALLSIMPASRAAARDSDRRDVRALAINALSVQSAQWDTLSACLRDLGQPLSSTPHTPPGRVAPEAYGPEFDRTFVAQLTAHAHAAIAAARIELIAGSHHAVRSIAETAIHDQDRQLAALVVHSRVQDAETT